MATTNFVDGVTPLIASWHNDVDKATYTNKDYGKNIGAANAYVVNLAVAKTAYYDGLRVDFSTANANTAAASLNVNGLGAIQIVNQGGIALEVGQIRANTIMSVAYNAAANVFEVLNASAADATAKVNAEIVRANAAYLPRAGDAAQVVSVAPATLAVQAVNLGQFVALTSGFKLPNGYIVQAFSTAAIAGGSSAILFPTAFPTSVMSICITAQGSQAAATSTSAAFSPTLTGFNISNTTGVATPFFVIAIGR